MSKPKALADNFTKDIKIGITIGKLRIANKLDPESDLAAMADVKVKAIEKLTAANPSRRIKNPRSRT